MRRIRAGVVGLVLSLVALLAVPGCGRQGPSRSAPPPSTGKFRTLALECQACGHRQDVRAMAFINDMIQVDPQSGQIACPKCGKAGATVHCLSCNTAVTTVKVDKTKGAVLCGKCGHSLHGQEQGR